MRDPGWSQASAASPAQGTGSPDSEAAAGGAGRGLELTDWSQHSKGGQDPGVCSVLISFQPTLYWLTGEKAVDSSLKSNNFFRLPSG